MNAVNIPCLGLALLSSLTFQSASLGQPLEPELYSRLPQISRVLLSPSGTYFAAEGVLEDRATILIKAIDHGGDDLAVPFEHPVDLLAWADDTRLVLRERPRRRGRPSRLIKIDVVTGEVASLYRGISAADLKRGRVPDLRNRRERLVGVVPGSETTLMLGINEGQGPTIFRVPSERRLFALDLDNGRLTLVERIPTNAAIWFADPRGRGRVVATETGTTVTFSGRAVGEERWADMLSFDYQEARIFRPLTYDPADLDVLYALSNHQDSRVGLYRWNMKSNAPSDVPVLPLRQGFYDVLLNPTQTEIYAVRYRSEENRFLWLADEHRDIFDRIEAALPNRRLTPVAASNDIDHLILKGDTDDAPAVYYLYVREDDAIRTLGTAYPLWVGKRRSPIERIDISTSSNQGMEAFLTRPARESAAESGPGPAIVIPNGGPRARDYFEFDPLVQVLARQGYTVLQIDDRRDLPLGGPWVSEREWRPTGPDDVIAATRWLGNQTFVDAARICILGFGFGGYSALLAAAAEPTLYRCVASINAPADTADLDLGLFRSISSAAANQWSLRFRELRAPVFLAHGEVNRWVPEHHTVSLSRQLATARKVVEYHALEDEDHEIRGHEARKTLITEMDAFFRRYMH